VTELLSDTLLLAAAGAAVALFNAFRKQGKLEVFGVRFKLNLRAKVLIFTLGVVVMLLVTSHLATSTLVADNLREQLERRATQAMENLGEWLSARKEQIYSTAQILADSDKMRYNVDWEVPNWLSRELEDMLRRGEPDFLMVENTKFETRWVYQVVDNPLEHGKNVPKRAIELPEERWSSGLTEVVLDADRLLLTVGVPIRKEMEVLGLLTLGSSIDEETIRDMRYASGCDELSIISGGRLMMSTLDEKDEEKLAKTLPLDLNPDQVSYLQLGESKYLTLVQPTATFTGDVTAYIAIHFSDMEMRKLLEGISNALNLSALLAFLIFSILSIAFSGGLTTQLNQLVANVTALGEGRDEEPVEVSASDEVGVLARAFEELRIKLRHRTADLVRSERLASMGQIAAGVAHEINNPLGIVLGFTQDLLAGKEKSDPDTEALRIIEHETERCARVVKDLLNLARTAEPVRKPVDIRAIIDKTLKLFAIQFRDRNISIESFFNAAPLVLGDEQQLQQVFMNVIINSIHAMDKGGTLKVAMASGGELDGDPGVAVRIEDTGYGISEEQLRHIFDPFYTTKKGGGSGLGLFIVHRLVDAHGGKVTINSAPGKGTTCTIVLPTESGTE
jgi:signal transduction histidine kinase